MRIEINTSELSALTSAFLRIPKEEWLEIEWTFARWKFPHQLKEFRPKWWNVKLTRHNHKTVRGAQQKFIRPISDIVDTYFTNRDQVRYNMKKLEHPDEYIDRFFTSDFFRDPYFKACHDASYAKHLVWDFECENLRSALFAHPKLEKTDKSVLFTKKR